MLQTAAEPQSTDHESSASLRVVLYHHLTDDPGPWTDRLGVATPPERFEQHIDQLARDYDVVDLDTVLHGPLPRRPLLITFDDGYRSVADVAAPILESRGLSSVLFAATSLVGEDHALSLDNLLCRLSHDVPIAKLATAITPDAPPAETLAEIITRLVPQLTYADRLALPDRLAEQFGLDLMAEAQEAALYLQPADIADLPCRGMEIGNHTRHHLHCRCLDDPGIAEQIRDPQRQLKQWTGRPVRAFSYPYGSHVDATPRVQRALRESGHDAIFLVEARKNPRGHDGPTWCRVSFQDQPASVIRRRLEWLPQLRRLKDRVTRRPLTLPEGAPT